MEKKKIIQVLIKAGAKEVENPERGKSGGSRGEKGKPVLKIRI